jgi:two-component system phosphate regulon response regulator PhoB
VARILFVNDERDLVDVCAQLLGDAGHEVITLSDGKQAPTAAVRALPDLMILDWVVNDATAESVLRALRFERVTAHLPVLLISARVDGEIKAKLYGLDGYLRKPFSAAQLLRAVDDVLAHQGAAPLPGTTM